MKKYRFMLVIVNMLAKHIWECQGRDVKQFKPLTQKRINGFGMDFIDNILKHG